MSDRRNQIAKLAYLGHPISEVEALFGGALSDDERKAYAQGKLKRKLDAQAKKEADKTLSLFPGIKLEDQDQGERDRDRERKREARAVEREVEIPAVVDVARREACAFDLLRFLKTYLGEWFYLELSQVHLDMVAQVQESVLHGGRVSLVVPRGYGKTTIVLGALAWAICYGHTRYAVLVCAEGGLAMRRLKTFKRLFERTGTLLAEDFPEVCAPVAALEGASQRAGMQLIGGQRSELSWGSSEVQFARVDGAPASRAIVCAKGLDAAIRGLVDGEMRPDLVVVDDAQTRESANSYTMTFARYEVLKQDIEGLVGPQQAMTIIGLWTVITRWQETGNDGGVFEGDLAYRFSSGQEPGYRVVKRGAMLSMPNRTDLVEEYVRRVHEAQRAGDFQARRAHAWYLLHRSEIEAGAEAAWPVNYQHHPVSDEARAAATRCEEIEQALAAGLGEERDGQPAPLWLTEVSAIQSQLNRIASMGRDAWACEYQNEPPAPEASSVVRITAHGIMAQSHGLGRGVVPPGTVGLVAGRDVGRHEIHWVVAAVLPGRKVRVIDYGVEAVDSPRGHIDEATREGQDALRAVGMAIRDALRHIRDGWLVNPYRDQAGAEYAVRMTLSDSRYFKPVVCAFADEVAGEGAVFGHGTARGQRAWSIPRAIPARQVFREGTLYCTIENRRPRWHAWADAFKRDVHAGFMLPQETAGSVSLFKPETPSEHAHIAAQLTAEQEVELASGITSWQKTPGREKNHYLDAMYYCLAAAAILGEIEPDAAIDAAGYAERAEAAARLAPPMPADPDERYIPVRDADPRLAGGPRKRVAKSLEI